MKKLLYITTRIDNSGGVSRILSVKLNYLIKKYNYTICVFNTNGIDREPFYYFDPTIKFYHSKEKSNGLLKTIGFLKEIKEVCALEKPNMVVICDNGLKGSLIPFFLQKDLPIIYERHCSKNIKGSNFFENIKLSASNKVLDLNKNKFSVFVVLNSISKNHWDCKNIELIPNPIWFEPPKKLSSVNNKVAVVLGRNSPEKQYKKLLLIWEKVVSIHPEWHLKIYGQQVKSLQLDVIRMGLEDNVLLHDPCEQINDILLSASIYLNTSSFEEFGLAVLEAMAFGLPVVGFKSAIGLNTLVSNNVNGYLLEKDDIDVYTDKVIELIKNKELRVKFGRAGALIASKYELKKIMEQWHDLFNSI